MMLLTVSLENLVEKSPRHQQASTTEGEQIDRYREWDVGLPAAGGLVAGEGFEPSTFGL